MEPVERFRDAPERAAAAVAVAGEAATLAATSATRTA
jgi:hypothetical protein